MTTSTGSGTPYGAAAPAARIRILIADDHPIYRDGLAAVLGLHPDMEVVAEAGNGATAVELFRAHRPDVTLMDLSMPGMGGAEATAEIIGAFPGARIIALTTFQGDADIHRVLEAGARGYLLKGAIRDDVAQAVRKVHLDGWVIPESVAQRLAEFTPRVELTGRELEVLGLMARGMSNKAIAHAIYRTEATVKVHVAHVLQKLNVGDRTEAVVVAVQRGIIHLGG